jgi:hypothetical protein
MFARSKPNAHTSPGPVATIALISLELPLTCGLVTSCHVGAAAEAIPTLDITTVTAASAAQRPTKPCPARFPAITRDYGSPSRSRNLSHTRQTMRLPLTISQLIRTDPAVTRLARPTTSTLQPQCSASSYESVSNATTLPFVATSSFVPRPVRNTM